MAERTYGWTPERAKRALFLSFDKGDVVRHHPNNPNMWFVSSATVKGLSYKIGTELDGTIRRCPCTGNTKWGWCRHTARVSWEVQNVARAEGGRSLLSPPDGFNADGSRIVVEEVA